MGKHREGVATLIVIISALTTLLVSCTNAYRVDHPNYGQLADPKHGRYRISMREGQTYVVKRFVVQGESLTVLERDENPGDYDTDGVVDPEPQYTVALKDIQTIDEIKIDGKKTAIVTGLSVAVVGGVVALIGASGSGSAGGGY
jgi:hypothetical protein